MKDSDIRILLVDDHDVVITGITGILTGQPGMTIVDSLRGGEGLVEALERIRPDVLLLDIKMGESFDFFKALEDLKRLEVGPKVIIVSSELEPFTIINAEELGVHGYLFKEDALGSCLPRAIRQVLNGVFAASDGVKDYLMRANLGRQHNGLSHQQYEVLCLLVKGYEPAEIALRLEKESKEAVYSIIRRTRQKLDVRNMQELISKALSMGILPDQG
jgi:DNA-binding NarL/FixJ family response regulator